MEGLSFGLWHTTCWMGDYVTSVVQYCFFLFLSILDSQGSNIGPAYFSLPILLISWHCDIHRRVPVFVIPTRSAVSDPMGTEHSKPLHLRGNFEAPCPLWSICHYVECQEVSLGLTTGRCSPWHLEREKEERLREGEDLRITLTKP